MEWMNRGARPVAPASQTAAPAAASPSAAPRPGNAGNNKKVMSFAFIGLLFSGALLIVALAIYIAVGGKHGVQANYVSTEKMQAVFLNGGQVYFGNIKEINNRFLKLDNIYYLRVDQQVQPNGTQATGQPSLVKLGCELHGPQDSMIINQEQVVFWENLKDDGQVTKAVKDYIEQNPEGQQCEAPTENSNTGANTTPSESTSTQDDAIAPEQ